MNFELVTLNIPTGNNTIWYEVNFQKEMTLNEFISEVTENSIIQENSGSFVFADNQEVDFMLYDTGKNVLLDRRTWNATKDMVVVSCKANKDRLNNIRYIITLKEEEENDG